MGNAICIPAVSHLEPRLKMDAHVYKGGCKSTAPGPPGAPRVSKFSTTYTPSGGCNDNSFKVSNRSGAGMRTRKVIARIPIYVTYILKKSPSIINLSLALNATQLKHPKSLAAKYPSWNIRSM